MPGIVDQVRFPEDWEVRGFELDELRVVDPDGDEGVDQVRRIEGHAAVFNQLSEDLGGFRERIEPGAFAKTIQEADVRALFNHNANYVLGRNRAGTLRLDEDRHGLWFSVDVPETSFGKDLVESVRRGDVNQCSFGFQTVKDDWEADDAGGSGVVRTLKEVKLFDVSVVTFPAYAQTSAAVRARFSDKDEAEPGQGSHSESEPDDQAKGGDLQGRMARRRRVLDLLWRG